MYAQEQELWSDYYAIYVKVCRNNYLHAYVTDILVNVFYILPIMLPLCLMLSLIHYAQNNAGLIGGSLLTLFKCVYSEAI